MAKDRLTPCKYYICSGECKKVRQAEHNGYCQKCTNYVPRVKNYTLTKRNRNWKRFARMSVIKWEM